MIFLKCLGGHLRLLRGASDGLCVKTKIRGTEDVVCCISLVFLFHLLLKVGRVAGGASLTFIVSTQ